MCCWARWRSSGSSFTTNLPTLPYPSLTLSSLRPQAAESALLGALAVVVCHARTYLGYHDTVQACLTGPAPAC